MTDAKSFCLVTTFYPPHTGGVETYIAGFAASLKKLGHKVTIVALNTEGTESKIIENGINIFRLPCLGLMKGRFPVPKPGSELFRLISEIKSINPDYFILNMRFYVNSLTGVYMAGKLNKPCFLIEHVSGHMKTGNTFVDFFGHIYEHLVTKYLKRRVDRFYGVSLRTCDWLAHFGIKVNGCIYNSVNPDDALINTDDERIRYDIPHGALIFTYAGRLIRDKGIANLIHSFRRLIQNNKNIYLLIAGKGDDYQRLKALSEDFVTNIIFTGEINHSQVINLLNQTDVVVNPSCYPEGLPTMLLEAGLTRCSVISTAMGGASEVIINEDFGIIIEPDDVDVLEQAMTKYITEPDYRSATAANLNKRILSEFTWDFTTANFLKTL